MLEAYDEFTDDIYDFLGAGLLLICSFVGAIVKLLWWLGTQGLTALYKMYFGEADDSS